MKWAIRQQVMVPSFTVARRNGILMPQVIVPHLMALLPAREFTFPALELEQNNCLGMKARKKRGVLRMYYEYREEDRSGTPERRGNNS